MLPGTVLVLGSCSERIACPMIDLPWQRAEMLTGTTTVSQCSSLLRRNHQENALYKKSYLQRVKAGLGKVQEGIKQVVESKEEEGKFESK